MCFVDHRGDLMIGHGQTQSLIHASQYLNGMNEVHIFSEQELLASAQPLSNDLLYELLLKD